MASEQARQALRQIGDEGRAIANRVITLNLIIYDHIIISKFELFVGF